MESMPKQLLPDTPFDDWKAQVDVDELNKHRKETWSEGTARHKYKLAAGAATLKAAGHSVYCRQQTETDCANAYGCRWRNDNTTCMPSWENAVRGVLDPSSTNSDNTDLKTPIAPKGQPKTVDNLQTELQPYERNAPKDAKAASGLPAKANTGGSKGPFDFSPYIPPIAATLVDCGGLLERIADTDPHSDDLHDPCETAYNQCPDDMFHPRNRWLSEKCDGIDS